MARRARPYWSCRCGFRNLQKFRKCQSCEKAKPKKRVTPHAVALRDIQFEEWAELSVEIHGGQIGACGVCGRMPQKVRRNDRDHDHITTLPRGLACPGLKGCNLLMPSWLTAARAQQIADYLKRVDDYYAAHQTELEGSDAG